LHHRLDDVWWLAALCGIFDAMHAGMNFLMLNADGLSVRAFGLRSAVWDMGVLALAAGACALAAGVWSAGKQDSWFLAFHGAALGVFGTIAVSPLVRGPLSFRPISVLFTITAVSIGGFALAAARKWESGTPARRVWQVAGVLSMAFALSFVAVGSGFFRLGPRYSYFSWMGSYFAFCAGFMLWLAFRLRRGRQTGGVRVEGGWAVYPG
jgi:hypothetical protein